MFDACVHCVCCWLVSIASVVGGAEGVTQPGWVAGAHCRSCKGLLSKERGYNSSAQPCWSHWDSWEWRGLHPIPISLAFTRWQQSRGNIHSGGSRAEHGFCFWHKCPRCRPTPQCPALPMLSRSAFAAIAPHVSLLCPCCPSLPSLPAIPSHSSPPHAAHSALPAHAVFPVHAGRVAFTVLCALLQPGHAAFTPHGALAYLPAYVAHTVHAVRAASACPAFRIRPWLLLQPSRDGPRGDTTCPTCAATPSPTP